MSNSLLSLRELALQPDEPTARIHPCIYLYHTAAENDRKARNDEFRDEFRLRAPAPPPILGLAFLRAAPTMGL
jgi:hypothetical protein